MSSKVGIDQPGPHADCAMVWEGFPMLVRSRANVTSENPERNDALRLEDGEQSDVRKPDRNGILRLEEMMSRKPRAINTY